MTEVRANAVRVDKLFRARCQLPGCGWKGTEQPAYQDANAEREAHLARHRRGTGSAEASGAPAGGRAARPPGPRAGNRGERQFSDLEAALRLAGNSALWCRPMSEDEPW